MLGEMEINLFGTELPFSWGREFVMCCGIMQLRLCTICASSRSEALVGFVAEKLSQVVGDFQVNLFGTELPFFTRERVCAVLPKFGTLALYTVRR